jgi:uncharacterized protein YyaL (SSP411 family)
LPLFYDEKSLRTAFEKMLYDIALLCMAYTEVSEILGEYDHTVLQTILFIMREIAFIHGVFLLLWMRTASNEGKYYLWRRREKSKKSWSCDGKKFCVFTM